MKKERRWLKSVIAASAETPAALPFARGTRRRPATLTLPPTPAKSRAQAAR